MSDDSFFREVNEELRQDRARALWDRYGKILIGAIVLVIAATAAIVFWRDYQDKQAAASGDRFLAALEKAEGGDRDAALVELEALQGDSTGEYAELARFKRASLLADEGSTVEAVRLFDEIAADGGAPQTLRDFAALRAGYLLVDENDYDAVAQRVEYLATESNALRFSAREALGLAAWKAGRADQARELFGEIVDDLGTPENLRRRATMMSDLIAAGATAEGGSVEGNAPVDNAGEAAAGDGSSTAPSSPAEGDETAPVDDTPSGDEVQPQQNEGGDDATAGETTADQPAEADPAGNDGSG
ncbi:hypothetical protein D8780_03515 [Notoacmeibacter ruber]|uniref:Ancillary SecYEG translocon subunit/Cell division coordinator CpoB TPR domain-containing protein n=1 Tax=Notoacmeibacter ruber TaxID=2670375 RepID=A0A3L7J9I7_9HYPH|nr:tetratricopeptide repeat protein [Notoacmeibacter ruber]RLQ87408.1 hypothetical protein D8780_03515 [Notoacmeibacter ruber]